MKLNNKLSKTLLVGMMLINILANDLTAQNEANNLKKYWQLRDAYKKKFTKIGKEKGDCTPLTIIPNGAWSKHNCEKYEKFAYVGDAGIRRAWYLTVLAAQKLGQRCAASLDT